MAENKNKLAETKETAIATYDDDLLSGGTGLEETTTEDFAIPFIRILQQMSPQLNKQDGRYNEEAQAGMLVNTVTNEVYDGDTGVTVVPCAYVKKYIEWIPREKGGGLVDASHNASILKSCTKNPETRRLYLDNGNEIVETAQFFVLVLDPQPQQAVIAFTSTQLGASRKWLTMLRMARVNTSKGTSVSAPMFAYNYKLGTLTQSNDKGTWHGYTVSQENPTDIETAQLSKEFMGAARSGDVEVKEEQQRDGTTQASGDAPF
tara:strand:+ start:1384 stop:2169 length:786 start_codon:yes stop_codon:yes gene_type:complete